MPLKASRETQRQKVKSDSKNDDYDKLRYGSQLEIMKHQKTKCLILKFFFLKTIVASLRNKALIYANREKQIYTNKNFLR